MSSIAALLASKPRFCRNTSSTSTSTAVPLSSSAVAVAAPILVDLNARPRLQFDASASGFKHEASQEQPTKLKIAPSPAHKVAIVNRVDGDYCGQVAQLEFQPAVSTKSFKLEDTDEYKWLMEEIKLEAEDDQDDLNLSLINAFPQPPSFSVNKTDRRQKRQGVIFDFPKVQSGVDCGKWW
ncbi:hypothetical protein V5O48_015344 [Marasmius crinis-equi]|uniref:Uncharacterized protein n=1 Tax=Marasmius crinis-equi TaxID=585013 RepID=A0ABR3EUS4_9AGAR